MRSRLSSSPTMAARTSNALRYEGEDTRTTSNKELRGFYAYGWASEVFVVCGMGSFIPITLEQLARERGVLSTDHVTPCTHGLEPPIIPPNMNLTTTTQTPRPGDAIQCILQIYGFEVNTASFAMYTFSASVFIQFLLIISMSGAADHGSHRKMLLLVFSYTGAFACMMFLPLSSDWIVTAAVFAIIANTCYGASSVLLNSFLPLLVRHHPEAIESTTDMRSEEGEAGVVEEHLDDEQEVSDENEEFLQSPRKPSSGYMPELEHGQLSISTRISSIGIGIGYIAALLLQTISIYVVQATGSTIFSLRLVLFLIGLWWAVFAVPSALWLRPRPGPPLHLPQSTGTFRTLLAYTTYSWKSLGLSLMRARKLKDVLLFLAAWFLLSDAVATVSGTAILFAKTSLQMKPAALALINVISTLSGIVGAFTWRRISRYMGLKPNQTVLACIALFEIIPLYGLLGYLPFIRRWGVGGLQQGWEMYPLGVVYGFVLGGIGSFCRSVFGDLVPPGFEAAFFALYAVTDKGSSVFGPAIVGAITDATGHIRPAFWFLAALIAAPFPLLMMVDSERGKREGIALAKELAKSGGMWADDEEESMLHGQDQS